MFVFNNFSQKCCEIATLCHNILKKSLKKSRNWNLNPVLDRIFPNKNILILPYSSVGNKYDTLRLVGKSENDNDHNIDIVLFY